MASITINISDITHVDSEFLDDDIGFQLSEAAGIIESAIDNALSGLGLEGNVSTDIDPSA